MKKLCLTAGLGVVAALVFAPGALAWTFSASATATCDRATGEHVVSWSIDNRTEPQALTIRESSRGSVPVGSTVAARSMRQFQERVVGTTTGTLTLIVKGNWPTDQALRTRFAAVSLGAGCALPPVDVCPNLEGVQTQVPSGMVKNSAGSCVPPPTDLCPNVEGVQEQIPSGLIRDSAGNCTTPPVDVCPNLEGVQASLPPDFVVEANGECAYAQRVVTITVEKTVEVPGPERLVSVSAAPVTVERVVTKVVIKRVKVARKKAKRAKRKLRPRVLPFTP